MKACSPVRGGKSQKHWSDYAKNIKGGKYDGKK